MAQAFVPDDLAPFFVDLGFTDIKAVGFSSVAEEGMFRNRVFIHVPEGRRGLLAGWGGAPAPFAIAALAPADADFVFESDVDLPAAYQAIRAVVARGAGEPAAKEMDAKLSEVSPGMPVKIRDVIDAAKGRFSLVVRIDETKTFSPSPGIVLPMFDLAIRQEHGGQKLAEALMKANDLTSEERPGGVRAFTSKQTVPLLGWRLEIVVEGDSFIFVTQPDFLAAANTKLTDEPAFRSALASLGETGNGMTYVSPRFGDRVRRMADTLTKQLPAEQHAVIERFLGLLPESGATLVAVRQNLPDGILFKSRWNSSLKSDLVTAHPGVVVIGTGFMAAMAIPAFQKVRANSQEKVVLNNLRQLAAARDQYFLENAKTSCTYADLVGPDKYIREIKSVAGEDYTRLNFREGEALRVKMKTGKVVEYSE